MCWANMTMNSTASTLMLISGDRVEVVLTVESKNDCEYLLLEDLKPAGLEAVQVKSGESMYLKELKPASATQALGAGTLSQGDLSYVDNTGRTSWVYQELRDRKVALFISSLPKGIWEIRYDLQAEVPGNFHALPVLGQAMYAPDIRANGAEVRLTVIGK